MSGGYLGLPAALEPTKENMRRVATVVNNMLAGKQNSVTTLTLTANSATTTVTDPRIGPNSALVLVPTTAHAATEFGAGTWYWSSQGKQTATLTHANNAQVDRTFMLQITG